MPFECSFGSRETPAAGESVREKYASGKKEGPRKGRWHAGKICRAGFYHEEKPEAYAGHSIFVFAAQADWMTTACILAGNPL